MSDANERSHHEPASKAAPSAADAGWHPSRYNIVAPIPDDERGRVAVLNLLRNSCRAYAPFELVAMDMLDELPAGHPAVVRLARRGLVVNFDERSAYELMSRSAAAGTRRSDLTICPTMGCNFDCPYCFEDHTPGRMAAEVQDDVVALAGRMLEASGARLLHVAWYGGEPLLMPGVIESLSERLMALAEERGVAYGAHIITNGYLLTEDVAAMLGRARVEYAQVTLDGVGAAHDATRHLAGGGPTYERIVQNISRPGLPFEVLLRQNVHERNLEQVEAVRELCESISAASGNRVRHAAQLLFDNDRSAARCDSVAAIEGKSAADVLLNLGRLPTGLRPYPCGAGNLWEVAVDPEGRLFKCWEIVDKPQFAFGYAHDWDPADPIYTASEPDKLTCYLNQAAPQNHRECADCLWLPLCAGGCPHQRLLGNGRDCLPYKDRPEEYALARLRLQEQAGSDEARRSRMRLPEVQVREVDTTGLTVVCDHLDMTVWRTDDGRAVRCGERTQTLEDACAVYDAYDDAFRATGVTPRPFEVVRVGERYGVVVEYVLGMTLGLQLTLGGYTPADAGEALGEVALRVHRAHAHRGLDMHAAYETMAERVSPLLERPQARRLTELVHRIPQSDTLLHGDLHPGNVVVYDGDLRLIDMDTVGFGHPAFELACMEAFVFRGLAEKVEQFGMTMEAGLEAARTLWEAVLRRYFRGRSDDEVAQVATRIEILAELTRCLGGPAYLTTDNEATRAWMRENVGSLRSLLDEALPQVERLDFNVEGW